MREWVDATCELGAHARSSIPEASEIAERGKGARGDSTKKSSEEGEREAMRKMDMEREGEPRERTCGEVIRTGESFIVLFIPSHTITLMTRSKRDSRETFIPRPSLFPARCFHPPPPPPSPPSPLAGGKWKRRRWPSLKRPWSGAAEDEGENSETSTPQRRRWRDAVHREEANKFGDERRNESRAVRRFSGLRGPPRARVYGRTY